MAEPAGGSPPAASSPAARRPGRFGEFGPTAAFVLLVLGCTRPGLGFVLPLTAPLLLVWFLRMAWLAWRRPSRRRAQVIKLAIILGVLLAAALAHLYYKRQARIDAQKVVDAVSSYRKRYGVYPDDLSQVGLDAQDLRQRWRVSYFSHDGDHRVSYAATFTLFDTWTYDFDKPGWQFHAD